MGSPEYLDNYNFTYTQGAKNSQYRAPYNTNTSLFWADLDGAHLARVHNTVSDCSSPDRLSLACAALHTSCPCTTELLPFATKADGLCMA